MKTKFYLAKCQNCSTSFNIPTLSDMAYGEFIAMSTQGKDYLFFNAIESSEWTFLSQYLNKHVNSNIQWLISECMDKVNNEKLSIIDKPKCPNCQENHLRTIKDISEAFLELKEVSFDSFNSLNDEEKILFLDQLLQQVHLKAEQ